MTGLLPAILRYTALFESDRRRSRQGGNGESSNQRPVSTVPSTATTCSSSSSSSSSSSNSSSSSSSSSRGKSDALHTANKETESILVRCMTESSERGSGSGSGGADEASKGKTNHAIVCLQELYEKARQRPLPDSGAPLSPPPLLLQTLLWLLIRCEEGERDLVKLLLPHCEKFLGSTARSDNKDCPGNHDELDEQSNSSSSSTPFVLDIDLNFLLRECYRCLT